MVDFKELSLGLNYGTLILFSTAGFIFYLIGLVVYRLYFHPLSSIPGPKIAAATLWYEYYHDVTKKGTYIWRIREMHAKYGPIVRISPNCIHINTPSFYDIYSGRVGEKRDKYPWAMTHFATPQAMISTVDHDHHRLRRSAVAKYFSKSNIRTLEPMIKSHIEQLLVRLKGFEKEGEPIDVLNAFKALTSDVVTHCAFGESHKALEMEDFNEGTWKTFQTLSHDDAFTNHVSWFLPFMVGLPDWVQSALGMEHVVSFKKKSIGQLEAMVGNRDLEEKGTKTVFRDVLASNLPEHEKTVERMWHDGQVFNIAGAETTAFALANCLVYMLSEPSLFKRLRDELKPVLKNGSIEGVSWAELEALPFLSAVIKESLRLSYGVVGRLYRISPDKDQVFNDGKRDWILPAGTPIGMTIPLLHHDTSIFPDPETFNPSRWLEDPTLDKYLFSFSKGPRACVGLNLAWAELYLTVAAIWGRYGCEGDGEEKGPKIKLWKTSIEDVVLKHDYFVPGTSLDSKGVKVVVLG